MLFSADAIFIIVLRGLYTPFGSLGVTLHLYNTLVSIWIGYDHV